MDRGRLISLSAIVLGLLVLSFTWSTALYIMLGFTIEAVRPWSVYEFMAAYGVSDSNV